MDEISQAIDAARRNAVGIAARDPDVYLPLEQAHRWVLRAETSSNFSWHDWLQRGHDDLDQATDLLDRAVARISPDPA